MRNSTKSTLFKLPAEILIFGSLLASVYAKFFTTANVSYGAVFILLAINLLYFIEKFLFKHDYWRI